MGENSSSSLPELDRTSSSVRQRSIDGSCSPQQKKKMLEESLNEKYLKCPHKMRPATLPPSTCSHCHEFIWGIHKQGMKCILCGIVSHTRCLSEVIQREPSPSPPPTKNEGMPCAHRLRVHTMMRPAWCTACDEFIWGISAMKCLLCASHLHKRCSLTVEAEIVDPHKLRKMADEEQAEEEAAGRGEALTTLHTLLSEFSSRWPVWKKICLLNPVALARTSFAHARAYRELPTRFPELTDVGESSDLAHAMLYAKAVYGVAYAKGHLKSCGAAVRLQTVWRPFRDMGLGSDVTAKENDAAVLKAVEAVSHPERELVMSDWSNQVYRTAFCVFADHGLKWIILSARGTVSQKDVLTDICAGTTTFLSGEGHEGIVRTTMNLVENASLNRTLDALTLQHPDYRIIVTGHSLGGGVATLYSMATRGKGGWRDRVECLAFAPPPTVTKPLLEEVNGEGSPHKITSVVCGFDAVCRMGLGTLERLAREVVNVKKEELGKDMPHVRMFVPGRLVFIDKPVGRSRKGPKVYCPPSLKNEDEVIESVDKGLDPRRDDSRTVECTAWLMSMLFVSRSMFADHLPDRYHKSLLKWTEQLTSGTPPAQAKVDGGEEEEEEVEELNRTGWLEVEEVPESEAQSVEVLEVVEIEPVRHAG